MTPEQLGHAPARGWDDVLPVVLGPAPCHGCGLPLVWDGKGWWQRNGLPHGCVRFPCMSAAEWDTWMRANAVPSLRSSRAPGPCADFSPAFAATMRAIYRCNGTPGRQGRGPDRGPRKNGRQAA